MLVALPRLDFQAGETGWTHSAGLAGLGEVAEPVPEVLDVGRKGRPVLKAPCRLQITLPREAGEVISERRPVFLRLREFELLAREGDQAFGFSRIKFPRLLLAFST